MVSLLCWSLHQTGNLLTRPVAFIRTSQFRWGRTWNQLVVDAVQFVGSLVFGHCVCSTTTDPESFFKPSCSFVSFFTVNHFCIIPIMAGNKGRVVHVTDCLAVQDRTFQSLLFQTHQFTFVRKQHYSFLLHSQGYFKTQASETALPLILSYCLTVSTPVIVLQCSNPDVGWENSINLYQHSQ